MLRSGIVSAALVAFLLAAADTFYFSSPTRSRWQPVLTPLNLLMYNISSSNLALHGTHPRWLHLVVNWQILFGVSLPVLVYLIYKRLISLDGASAPFLEGRR